MDFTLLILQLIFFLCAVGATTVASVSLPEISVRSSRNNDVVIASIFPESGPTCGGTDMVLTIRRSIVNGDADDRYSDDLACAFVKETDATAMVMTMTSTPARWMSTTEILCETPKWTVNDDNVTLNLISMNGIVVATSSSLFYYYETPTITSIHPTFGTALGGTRITLRGYGFSSRPGMTCRFGSTIASAQWMSNIEIVCTSPPAGGAVILNLLSVSLNGVDYSTSPVEYRYTESPLVHTILPSQVSVSRGSELIITGQGFEDTDVLACIFRQHKHDEVVSTSADFISPTKLRCHSPTADEPTQATVHVTVNGVDETVDGVALEFTEDAVIQTIMPSSGPVDGGTWVTLTGTGLVKGLHCRFGSNDPVPSFWISRTEIQCISPPQPSSGITNVSLVEYPLTALEYIYFDDTSMLSMQPSFSVDANEMPRLHHLDPHIVVAHDNGTNTVINVKGENFAQHLNLTCMFDNQPSDTTIISDTEVLCRLRLPNYTRSYEVRLSVDGVVSPEYRLLDLAVPPLITLLNPTMGQTGTELNITGTSFHPSMLCQFGGRHIVETQFINSTMLQCTVPAISYRESIPVSITLFGNTVSIGPEVYFTHVDLSLAYISPTFGQATGGTRVTFSLKEETPDVVSHCMFGSHAVSAIADQLKLVCVSPPSLTEGSVPVGVSVNGGDFAMSSLKFEYTKPALFISMHPTTGPESGGTIVRVTGTNFVKSHSAACFFGDTKVAGRVESAERLTCETPMLKPGSHNVSISLNGADVLNTYQLYDVYPRMTALYSVPRFGQTNGGTLVAVYGTNFRFDDVIFCYFGGVSVNARYVRPNMIECVTPKREFETRVDLSVVTENGDKSITGSGFEFYKPFRILSIYPAIGSLRGGTNVAVRGDFFTETLGPAHCLFSHVQTNATVESRNIIRCSTPPSSISGAVEFALTYGSDKFIFQDQGFEYEDAIILEAVLPRVIPNTIDRLVTVYGSRFRNTDDLKCALNGNQMTLEAIFVNESQVVCRIPQGLKPGVYALSVSNNGQDFSDSTSALSVMDLFRVKSIHPTVGSPDSVNNVSVIGSGLYDLENLACFVDQNFVVPAHFINTTLLQCSIPPNLVDKGTVSVALTLDGATVSTGPDLLFTFIDLSLASISPTFGHATGGTRVTFSLKEETPDVVSRCMFGSHAVSAIADQSKLVCVSPPSLTEGSVPVGVSVNGEDFSMSSLKFEYTKPALFVSMHPTTGPESGGTIVRVTGANFVKSHSAACFFGDTKVVGRVESAERLTCETPAKRPGNYKVRISLNGVDTLRTSLQYSFHKEIDVRYASPSIGSILGGTEVSIIGKSFVSTENLTCQFGAYGYSRAAFISSTEIFCLSPNISPTVTNLTDVDVQVSLNGIDFSTASAQFRFAPPAVVYSIDPSEGSVSGGTEITVKGANMFTSIASNSAVCIFGNESVPASLLSTAELTCVSPAHSIDEGVHFAVSLNGVDLIHPHDARFVYTPRVKNVSIEPNGGPLTGGTLVTITGTDFDRSNPISCKFGSSNSDGIVYISEKTIQCRSPRHDAPGTVDFVVVTRDNHLSLDDVIVFEYYKPPTVLFAGPSSGPHHGGTVVRIYGSGFRSNVDYLCYFGGLHAAAQFIATDAIECLSPMIRSDVADNHVDLVISETKSNFTANTLGFLYLPVPSLTSLRPRYVYDGGDNVVSVYGSNLNVTGDVWCRFTLPSKSGGSYYYETSRVSSSLGDGRVDCAIPDYPPATLQIEAFVDVSSNGWDYSTSPLSIYYVPRPTIHSVHPKLGSVNGGTVITILGANFLQESKLWCAFGSAGSVLAEWSSREKVLCIAPASHFPVNTSVSLHFDDDVGVVEGDQYFAYHRELSLEEAYPSRGFVTGGTVITITGTGLLNVPTLSCQFGNKTVTAKFISSNSIECMSPQANHAQDVELGISLNGVDFSGGWTFKYDTEVALIRIIPSRIPVTDRHSSNITVVGESFVNTTSLSCLFGQSHLTNAHYVSVSMITCILPPVVEEGEIDVRISLNGVDFSSDKASVTFVGPALISSISPLRIQEGHEIEVLVKGRNFINSTDLQCRFGRHGHYFSHARWIDEGTLTCITPQLNMTRDGVELVGISNNGGHDTSRQTFGLEVTARMQFVSIHPSIGYTHGGTEVTITLGNLKFMMNLRCLFGNEAVPASLTSANSVVCQSPQFRVGKTTVKLMSGEMILVTSAFEYINPPTVDMLQPAFGPFEGGTVVWVYGGGFVGVTHCRFIFNDKAATVVAKVDSDSSLSCVAPASEEDADAFVDVTHNGQDFSETGHAYQFRAQPRLFNIAPLFGSDLGGTVVYVSGENFVDTPTMCRFGTALVDAAYISSTLLSCVSPLLKIGSVPVSITMNGVDFVSNDTLEFESITLPQIQSIEPNFGTYNRNTTIVLHTTAMREDQPMVCHFGERKVQALYRTSNAVSCVAPASDTPSVVDVYISVGGESHISRNEVSFSTVYEPKVTAISPTWTTGGGVVSLSVERFGNFHSLPVYCSVGNSITFTKALEVKNDTVLCDVPLYSDHSMKRSAPVSLRIGDVLNVFQIDSPSEFTFYEPAVVTKVEPPIGSVRGGSIVRVAGINFSSTHFLQCLFGVDNAVDAEFVDEREVKCVAPEWYGGPKKVDVHIGVKEGAVLSLISHAIFEYLPHPAIQNIHPRFGSINGGNYITIQGNAISWPHASSYLSCRFGNSPLVSVTGLPTGELACITPRLQDTALVSGENRILTTTVKVNVSLYANHGQVWLASSDESFVYVEQIAVGKLRPNSGSFSGGTNVTISAGGLHHFPIDEITCHFGDDVVPATYHSNNDVLKCSSPAMISNAPSKIVMLHLGINGSRVFDSVGSTFTYYRSPTVTTVHPTFGFMEGGEDVIVSGAGFRNEEGFGCTFGHLISPKAVWLSDTAIRCTSPDAATMKLVNSSLTVRVANNGVDYTDGADDAPKYMFIYRPDASNVHPRLVNLNEKTVVTITGKNLEHIHACRFGNLTKAYRAVNVTNNSFICEAPLASDMELYNVPVLLHTDIPVFFEMENGVIAAGLDVTYIEPASEVMGQVKQHTVTSILPGHGASDGGDWIRVYGDGFVNTNILSCRFGQTLVTDINFISPYEIHCRSPAHLPGSVLFDVVSSQRKDYQNSSGLTFTFVSDVSITSIFPSSGSIRGGMHVRIFGSFVSSYGVNVDLKCRFGLSAIVKGELVSQNEVLCVSPLFDQPETIEVKISLDGGLNFAKSSIWFTYAHESEIETLIPSYGYPDGGASILIVGKNFRNSTGLRCLFDEVSTSATFHSAGRVSCDSPSKQMKRDDTKTVVRLASDGEIGSSWMYFEYVDRPQVTSFSPAFGYASQGATITVRGTSFRPILQLMCAFGKLQVQATVIDQSMLTCDIPRHPTGVVVFRIVDHYSPIAAFPHEGEFALSKFQFIPELSIARIATDAAQAGSISFARGTNFDSPDFLSCRYGKSATSGAIVLADSLLSCPSPADAKIYDTSITIGISDSRNSKNGSTFFVDAVDFPTAPNGTTMNHNITLCEPGTFQPRNGQHTCLPCPIGFICPSFGLTKPIICPAGSICDKLGLRVPSSQCVAGHYCNKGTKVSSPMSQFTNEIWNVEETSGILRVVTVNSAWDFIDRTPPATGVRRIAHPPINEDVEAQQPFPCPLGYFCREGVSSATHINGDYTTPQRCFDGYFCPAGSTTPEGTGACPTGFYCPSQTLAIACEEGHHCPGVGNVSPLPCFPGTYSATPGHSNCILCEIGFQCPGFGRVFPQPCQAGWVCDEMGLSVPTKRCPSGYVCQEGTTTDNPNQIGFIEADDPRISRLLSIRHVPPYPCPPGSFCLGGVSHTNISSWLPSFEMGISAPQPCLEGYYCPSNSSTPLGGGKCYPGHYCPENSPYPIQTPPGTFAGADGGAIAGSLCLPGTFAPRSGQITCSPCPAGSSCLTYGTYVPRICGPGTYRSKGDSVQSISCRPCPDRTYSFDSGLTDISQCLPCAEGRVCGQQGMTDLKQSDACSEGKVCGYMTDRSSQIMNLCPGGSYCGNETTTLNQYLYTCSSGSYCERGTTSKLKTRDKCAKNHYCSSGTPKQDPLLSRCPRQTTSFAGAKVMDLCFPNFVAICDKMPFSSTNPFDGLLYYPIAQEESVEMLVTKKILPLDKDSSDVVPWVNDTVEVLRSCPSYGVYVKDSTAKSTNDTLTIIGRNFVNSSTLTCRYRFCQRTSWMSVGGVMLTDTEQCRDETSSLSEPITHTGTYISKTRVSCPLPAFNLDDTSRLQNISDIPIATQLCLRDENDQIFLSRLCTGSDLISSNQCAFEDSVPYLGSRRRIYSLIVPCLEDDGWCDDVPSASSNLNPCLTRRMLVDVSNTGKKYTGDETVIPYTSPSSTHNNPTHAADDFYRVHPTYVMYDFIPNEYMALLEVQRGSIAAKHLKSSIDADGLMCQRSNIHEEGRRLGEEGWFESPYMSRFHMSFDWRHLPAHLVYNQHYKLAIYVAPSRCRESKCEDDSGGRSHKYVEYIPCLQPLVLPVWFTDDSIDKRQVMNLTLTSLDDSKFRVEIHVVNGLALPIANSFEKTMTVVMEQPQRANTLGDKRSLSPLVSFEEKTISMPYIFGIRYDVQNSQQVSLPRNLPPRWKAYERGRVLVGMNTTRENDAITIKDGPESIVRGEDYWDNPFPSATMAKQQSDIYFETFHGISRYEPNGAYKYEYTSLILPYLPFFSNCREFDSHVPLWAVVESATQCELPGVTEQFPEDWWRRGIPPLPHQDDVVVVRQTDFLTYYPVADWCERKLQCTFEEDLPKPAATPRWFDVESGTVLFSIIRDPIDYYQYTGKDSTIAGIDDGGGQRFINEAIEKLPVQTFVPAIVDRSSSLYIEGGCSAGSCFPRSVTLDVSYQQLTEYSKRIVQVQVRYDEFDKDALNDEYKLEVKFYPLNYEELLIKFAFSHELFLLLFIQIGAGTVAAAFVYWIVVRLTTNLERPPRLRIFSFVWLTFSPILSGFLLALMPISIVTGAVFYLMKGYQIFTPDDDPDGRRWLFLSSTRLHYSDVAIDPDNLLPTRQGRTGLAFFTMALISLYFTSRMFAPKLQSKSTMMTDQQVIDQAMTTWKRGNLIYCSVIMGLFLVVIVEWSFWGSFGEYIWEAIIFLEILQLFVGSIVDKQLGESLLSAPVMMAMGLVQGIVTMSANDFMDFLLSWIVGFGFLIMERMYTGPLQEPILDRVYNTFMSCVTLVRSIILPKFGIKVEQSPSNSSEDTLTSKEKSLTVEPLLGSYVSYSCDSISLLYMPFIMIVIMLFRDEMQITILYGIKEDDMEYYVMFALVIIPFQILADVFLHNALELLHGWKIYEYLEYCKVRFMQREMWWKGCEECTLDGCIEESLRSMDQWCFSSQYYMLNTIHLNAIVYFVFGVEMMVRAKYTAFGDPAMISIVIMIILCASTVKMMLTLLARLFGFWRIKKQKKGWHADVLTGETNVNVKQFDDVQVKDHAQFQLEQQITSDTFRYKFLSYNRSWLLSKLPDMLTPRVSASQKPYLINQLARILASAGDGDSSSDSDDSDDGPKFETPSLTASSRTLARTWLKEASRALRLKNLVQPLIEQSKGNECQVCLSRAQLLVETSISVSEMDEAFKKEYRTEDIDQVLFKTFWRRYQKYQTICLACVNKRKEKEREQIITDDRSDDDEPKQLILSDNMTVSTESILASWYSAARKNVNPRGM